MAQTSLPHLSSRERLALRRAADERLIDAIFGELFVVHRDSAASGRPACPDTAAIAAADAEHVVSTRPV